MGKVIFFTKQIPKDENYVQRALPRVEQSLLVDTIIGHPAKEIFTELS